MSDDGSHAVIRPSVPPLAWLAAGVWVGVAAAEAIDWRVFGDVFPWWVPGVLPCVGAGIAVAGWRSERPLMALLAAGVATGAFSGALCWRAWRADVGSPACGYRARTLTTATDAARGPFGASVTGVVTAQDGSRLRVVARFGRDGHAPELGTATQVRGSVKPARFDARGRDLHREGVVGTLSVRTSQPPVWASGLRGSIGRVRHWCVRRVCAVPGAAGALLSGVLLGDRRLLSGSTAESDFRTTGLTHLVAVSGSHLVVVAALVAWLLSRARAPRALSALSTLVVMTGYVCATGVQPSAVRALSMSVVAVGAVSAGRRGDRAAALCAAACVALVAWPPVAFDLGFALSVASVAALLLFARLTAGWLQAALPSPVRGLAEPLSLTLVAQAATFPIIAPTFGVVSLVAPVANLLVGPLVAAMLVVGLAGLALSAVNGAAGTWVLECGGALASLSVWLADRLASLPSAAVPVGACGAAASVAVVAGAVVLWMTWPRPHRAWARVMLLGAGLLVVAGAAGPPVRSGAEVVVLDVGQGDAILVRDGQHVALVDTGPDARALRQALARQGTRDLEWIAFTHAHDDHTGGTGALVGVHDVGAVLVPACDDAGRFGELADELRCGVVGLRAGQRVRVGSTTVTVVWPKDPVPDVGENSSSLVLLVQRGGRSVLLTGDAETDVLEPLARTGRLSDVDVLKVGHHGSRVSLSPVALAALRPEESVISVGAGNRFGHPTREAIELLRRAGSMIRRTDRDGDVAIYLGP